MKLPKTGPLSFESPCFKTARSCVVIENGQKLSEIYHLETPHFEGCGGPYQIAPICAFGGIWRVYPTKFVMRNRVVMVPVDETRYLFKILRLERYDQTIYLGFLPGPFFYGRIW